MPSPDDKSYIEELKKSLYSRSAPDVRTRRKLRFSDPSSEVQTAWKEDETKVETPPVTLNTAYEDRSMSFFTKLLIFSFIFCIGAVGVGAYLFFNGANLISANNIEIKISGPVSIPGGEPTTFDITAMNKNNVDLQLVDMVVTFPDGTVDPAHPGQSLTSYTKLLGDISAGGSAHQSIQVTIFGEENLQKKITVSLTYNVKGSSVPFTKVQTYDVIINSSPVNLSVSTFKEVSAGQKFDMTVEVKSNSEQTLKSVLLQAQYPFGYTYFSSNLPTFSGNNIWKLGDIPAGTSRKIVISGKLVGEDTSLRAFHFSVGAQSEADPKIIGTQFVTAEQDITIEKPFVSLALSINSDEAAGDHVAQFGQNQNVEIAWTNNLPTTVSNMIITAKLSGTAYDRSSVSADQGYYDSSNDQIVWSQQTTNDLASVPAGANGTVSFRITPRDLGNSIHPVVNPTVKIDVGASGNRTSESNVPQQLSSIVSKSMRIASTVSLSGRVVRSIGPFQNTGVVPPKVGQQTTYTIIWDVDNTANAVGRAQVTALLPPYVKWLNSISPSDEAISYDSVTGQVTWNVGNVQTYSQNASRREVTFQVSLTPSISQVSSAPDLVKTSTLTAVDNFTGISLSSYQNSLTTRYSTDPVYNRNDEMVTN